MFLLAKMIVALVSAAVMLAGLLADWVIPRTAKQHIYNPKWPPHAKFHNGQTMSLGFLLGALSLFLLFRMDGDLWFQFTLGIVTASYYWLSMMFAGLFPHTAWVDPEFKNEVKPVLGLPPQQFLSFVMLILLAVAFLLGYIAYN
ncbi:hypothetical protein LJK88_45785 [Paenibacillus sp. P26]|nr:hypothetical protein LJK88_45785 [Paenibacillus sp. P26]UUZ92063.1 hypothetical protein LJK87_42580 [Paenibacillus sp. P25]